MIQLPAELPCVLIQIECKFGAPQRAFKPTIEARCHCQGPRAHRLVLGVVHRQRDAIRARRVVNVHGNDAGTAAAVAELPGVRQRVLVRVRGTAAVEAVVGQLRHAEPVRADVQCCHRR